jgi:hypothetical protein
MFILKEKTKTIFFKLFTLKVKTLDIPDKALFFLICTINYFKNMELTKLNIVLNFLLISRLKNGTINQ